MTNQIINFTFEAQTIRTATNPQGEIYFCLPDVASVLEISRSSDLLQIQKDFVKNETLKNRGTLDPKGVEKIAIQTKGGVQEVTFINEPNLYRVIFRSNKKEAVKFQNWVFNEVLPSIRKTGTYSTDRLSTVSDRKGLVQAVNRLADLKGVTYSTIWKLVHDYMNIDSVDELTVSQIPTAIAYVHSLMLQDNQPTLDNQALYTVLADSAVHLYDYMRMLKVLKGLPITCDTMGRNVFSGVVENYNAIVKLSGQMKLTNRQGVPMFSNHRINFYNGGALIIA